MFDITMLYLCTAENFHDSVLYPQEFAQQNYVVVSPLVQTSFGACSHPGVWMVRFFVEGEAHLPWTPEAWSFSGGSGSLSPWNISIPILIPYEYDCILNVAVSFSVWYIASYNFRTMFFRLPELAIFCEKVAFAASDPQWLRAWSPTWNLSAANTYCIVRK